MRQIHRLLLMSLFCCVSLSGAANAQGLIGKVRTDAVVELERLASLDGQGVRSGSCLRPIGDPGTEEFAVYLLLPNSRIEGFVVEMSGDDGAEGEIVANAGIVSFAPDGDAIVRGNLGLGWVADAYRVAANSIRSKEMHEDMNYADALSHLPTERCPLPFSWR